MKGLSTILAMILIVIIVVALIGLTYTFAVNLFGVTSDTATDQTEQLTDKMQKSVSITSISCNPSTNRIIFSLKNTGTKNIVATDLTAFVISNTTNEKLSFTLTPASLTPGSVSDVMSSGVTAMDLLSSTEYTVKVSAPAADVTQKVSCV